MDELEPRLRQALARQAAPEGFLTRVRAETQRRQARRTRSHRPWLAAAAALLLSLGGLGLYQVHRHQVQVQAQAQAQAEAQLAMALQITSHHLNQAFERVNHRKDEP